MALSMSHADPEWTGNKTESGKICKDEVLAIVLIMIDCDACMHRRLTCPEDFEEAINNIT